MLSRAVSRVTIAQRAYPVFDAVVMGYIAVVLLVQVLFQISPAVTFFASTPLISIQTWLGILGGALLVIDLFTTKRLWQGPFCLLLYGILVMAALASVRMIDYGAKQNLFKLCWAIIQFALVYSCAYRMEPDRLKKFIRTLFIVLLAIWLVACCVSLYQFVRQIRYDYVVNPMAQDSSSNRQGFYDNRLFGIFYTLNHAAYGSLIFFLVGTAYAMKSKRIFVKILLSVSNLILMSHIILAVSRSATIALMVCLFCLSFLMARTKFQMKSLPRLLLSTAVATLIVILTLLVFQVVKSALLCLPYATSEIFDLPAVGYDPALLDRNLGGDTSNGRLDIWADYFALSGEIGPVGMSPGNYMPYIHENHPDLHIVEYIREVYPEKYNSGIIHHVHNGYLMVFVSAGWIGAALLLAFGTLCILRLFKKLKEDHKTSYTILLSFLLVAAVALSAMFDEGIFFQNNPQTTVFWLALGVLMKECAPVQKKELPPKTV